MTEICRTCTNIIDPLEDSFLLTEYIHIENDKVFLSDVLKIFVSIQITPNDSLPKTMCNICKLNATNAYSFWKKCINSEKKLLEPTDSKLVVKEELLDKKSNELDEIKEIAPEKDLKIDGPDFSPLESSDEDNMTVEEYFGEDPNDPRFKKVYIGNTGGYVTVELQKHKPPAISKSNVDLLCESCGLVFKGLDKMRIHRKTKHFKTKPFICEKCGKSFVYNHLLKYHEEVHADNVYKCEQCGKTFNTYLNLKHHKLRHKSTGRFQCRKCKATFRTMYAFKKHYVTHTGEKNFICVYCGKRFNRKDNLDVHIKIHTGEKPFLCNVCGESFRVKCTLEAHIKREHSKETSNERQAKTSKKPMEKSKKATEKSKKGTKRSKKEL